MVNGFEPITTCIVFFCYIAGVSLDLKRALVGWFLFTRYRLKSNVAHAGNNSKIVARAGYNTKLILSQSRTEYSITFRQTVEWLRTWLHRDKRWCDVFADRVTG